MSTFLPIRNHCPDCHAFLAMVIVVLGAHVAAAGDLAAAGPAATTVVAAADAGFGERRITKRIWMPALTIFMMVFPDLGKDRVGHSCLPQEGALSWM